MDSVHDHFQESRTGRPPSSGLFRWLREPSYTGRKRFNSARCKRVDALRALRLGQHRLGGDQFVQGVGPVAPCQRQVQLSDAAGDEVLAVHEALKRLALLSPRLAQIVECRFFGGYDEVGIAEALGISGRTVRRDWVLARAWLERELASHA